ncbi:MAG: glutaredoxin family protein [Candidatus Latescibacter sp.]|nr:glutaredoxin family protein [Candidatus Latescibacter sp.]
MLNFNHVPGKNCGHIVLYALSTCGWCRKARKLLEEMGIEYSYIYVDLLQGEESSRARQEMLRWNPRGSFPTIVVNGETGIAGFDEEQLRKLSGV